MTINLLIILSAGVSIGLAYIYMSLRKAGVDPESFEHLKDEKRYKKPKDWKTGRLPNDFKINNQAKGKKVG